MSQETTDQLIAHLASRFETLQESVERVERGIFGDSAIGHRGLVARIDTIEAVHDEVGAVHGAMEKDWKAGDRRIHERIDGVTAYVRRVERKIDRLLFAFVGAGVVSGGSVAAIFAQLG
jgi:hypothetical protein